MTGDVGDDLGRGGGERGNCDGIGPSRPALARVDGPLVGAEPPPTVSLHREFKGLTVADLLRNEVVDRLPGQVRSALLHLQRGDLAAAERALPGEFAPVLPGPGHLRRERRLARFWLALFVAAGLSMALWWWWC